MNYTIGELEEKLEEFNVDRQEFSNSDLIILARKGKEYADKFFVDYENERLKVFAKMLDEFLTEGGENA